MTFPKRTFDKPIPISPTIALDRERCILCYRCTRFSSDVAEDGQLVARNRGAQSMIATFEDEAYRGAVQRQRDRALPGRRADLDPVPLRGAGPGRSRTCPPSAASAPSAATSRATTREGKVKRILSRNHPEVDEGWLCDKGRFAYPHLYADDRIVDPLERVRRRGFGGALLGRRARPRRGAAARRAGPDRHRALRLGDARAGVCARQAAAPGARRALGRAARGRPRTALDAFRAPLSTIADAEIVVVVGDEEVADRAPIVELWIKPGAPQRRRGRPARRSRSSARSSSSASRPRTAPS